MTEPVRVIPIASPWGRFSLYSFFIDAPEPAIVDTGIAVSPQSGIAPTLADLGLRMEDIRWILLTHGHPDHIGGAFNVWEATGRQANVAIHREDAELLRRREAHVDRYLATRHRYLGDPEGPDRQRGSLREVIAGELEPTHVLEGGERIPLGGDVSISVHHTPGHTPGSATFVIDELDWAFVGDAVLGAGGANDFPGIEDSARYRASLRHLAENVRPEKIFLGHRFKDRNLDPFEIELDRAGSEHVLRESMAVEESLAVAARRYWESSRVDDVPSPYHPFASVAAEVGYRADPKLEPAPFFITMNAYAEELGASSDVIG